MKIKCSACKKTITLDDEKTISVLCPNCKVKYWDKPKNERILHTLVLQVTEKGVPHVDRTRRDDPGEDGESPSFEPGLPAEKRDPLFGFEKQVDHKHNPEHQ